MPLPPFHQVLEEHGADVWRFAASQVGRERADDVFQETMLAALAAYPKLRDPSAVRSWLLRIAARKAVDVFRADAKAPPLELDVPAAGEPAAATPDDELWGRVAQLPDKQRRAVALRFLLDLRYADIGAAMETTPEAARRNVFEALKALRSAMTPLEAT
jgi:RNA polymerase sigma factor (sigma-70 family)